jgi:N-acyl-D-amino-acid deacylase
MPRAPLHVLAAALWLSVAPAACMPAPARPASAAATPPVYDLIVRGGTVYDGSGAPGRVGDVAVVGDSIAAVGALPAGASAKQIVDARGLAVAPGFINMLSWAVVSLLEDGRGMSDLKQGVTLEVFGEGGSMGPLNDEMKRLEKTEQGDVKYDVPWTTLGEYLDHLVKKGVSPNVASFVGATTVRMHELGQADRAPSLAELDRMQALVRGAMEEGALGVGSALIYAPGTYAKTPELVALAKAAAPYGGMYISHLRSEGDRLLEAADELVAIARESGAPAEIYHLKAAGKANWGKLPALVAKIEAARREGLAVTANMYPYPAAATGLDAAMPPWVQEGGYHAWAARLRDPATRARVVREMRDPSAGWENLLLGAGSPERVLLVGFKSDALKPLTGKTLAEVARMRGKPPEEAAIDLVLEDGGRVSTIYFLMSDENVRGAMALPWVSFASDEEAPAPQGVFLKSNPHPRAYGTFARVLGKYVREERALSLEDAVRRLTSLPAANLKLRRRGSLRPGFYADLVAFDPARVGDLATFERPHQYAVGVVHVFVNGAQVLRDGEHTGAKPGRVVRGPGWKGWAGAR